MKSLCVVYNITIDRYYGYDWYMQDYTWTPEYVGFHATPEEVVERLKKLYKLSYSTDGFILHMKTCLHDNHYIIIAPSIENENDFIVDFSKSYRLEFEDLT